MSLFHALVIINNFLILNFMTKGLTHIYTGNGKGKTTAALGTALRATGQGEKVLLIQFIKSNHLKTGERKAIKKYLKNIKIMSFGKGFINEIKTRNSRSALPRDRRALDAFLRHKNAARIALVKAKKAVKNNEWNLVILDEICIAQKLGLVEIDEIIKLIKNKRKDLNLILTGRSAHPKLMEMADLVTEMKKIKHPFDTGQRAKRGLDY